MGDRPLKGRLAPSPSGRMHAGNIYAALMSWLIVKSRGGRVVLRIEDLDRERSKQCWIDQVQRDFELLGITWDEGPFFQHDRNEAYASAFARLSQVGEVYPCFCTRADLHVASAPHRGEKRVYAGTCRNLSPGVVAERSRMRNPAWRVVVPDSTCSFNDVLQGSFEQNLARECGDFVVRRSDGAFAYQLAVVVDDAAQGVNCVVRGADLLESTPQQVYLQDLLGFEHVDYAHVPLIVAADGRRLSKRDKDAALDELLERFGTPEAVIGHIAALAGLIDRSEPLSCEELLANFNPAALPRLLSGKAHIQWQC